MNPTGKSNKSFTGVGSLKVNAGKNLEKLCLAKTVVTNESLMQDECNYIYAPVIVSIATTNPHIHQVNELSDFLISLLKEGMNNSSVEWLKTFRAHVLTLTYTILPPLSQLLIPTSTEHKNIVLSQGLFNTFPCDGDISIYYLFLLMPIDIIVKLWSYLLLDFTIVIYTSDPNIYFYVAKAFMELLFPLDYQCRIGLIDDLRVLKEESSCFVCVLKETCGDQSTIWKTLKNERMILVDFGETFNELYEITTSLKHPREERIIKELTTYSKDFSIIIKGIQAINSTNYTEFSSLVQFTFFNEMYWTLDLPLFEEAAKNKVRKEEFTQYFMRSYTKSHILSAYDFEYIEKVISSQSVMSLFDVISKGGGSNYDRVKAMEEQGLSSSIYPGSKQLELRPQQYRFSASRESIMMEDYFEEELSQSSNEERSHSMFEPIKKTQYTFYGEKSIITSFNLLVKQNEKRINKKLLRDLEKLQLGKKDQSEFIVSFNNQISYQRELFEALFYLKHGKDKVRVIEKMLKSFEYVEDTEMHLTYFPMKLLEEVLNSLSAVELRYLRSSIKDTIIIIRNLYFNALKKCKDKIYSKEIKLPFTPNNLKYFIQTNTFTDKPIVLQDFEPFTSSNSNPVIVIYFALEALVKLLDKHKAKKKRMFEYVGKLPQFELINAYLETLQVVLLIIVGW
jgi:hypothetical protein